MCEHSVSSESAEISGVLPPLVSVVVPTYNGLQYVHEAISSALAQDFTDHEVIVVDDGSTDGTAEVVERQFPGIRVLKQRNRGAAAARNAGVRLARGRYVAFLDDDDAWEPTKLSSQVSLFRSRPELAMVFTNWRAIREDGVPVPLRDRGFLLKGDMVKNIFLYSGVATPTVMVKKEVLIHAGLFDEGLHIGEDDNMWMRIALDWPVGHVSDVLVRVRVRSGSVSHDGATFFHGVQQHLEVMQRSYPRLWEHLGSKALRSKQCTIHRIAGYYYFERGDLRQARRHLRASLRNAPTMASLRLLAMALLPLQLVEALRKAKRRWFPNVRLTT
jgi:glycosyltransferase involved in cell wall biosynthesis